jgi:ribosomal protein RSM22 (predicted rRNA methylase)
VISEIKYRFKDRKFKTMLDYGAGLGAAGSAFIDLFPEY